MMRLDQLLQDVRHGFRLFMKNPGFTAIARGATYGRVLRLLLRQGLAPTWVADGRTESSVRRMAGLRRGEHQLLSCLAGGIYVHHSSRAAVCGILMVPRGGVVRVRCDDWHVRDMRRASRISDRSPWSAPDCHTMHRDLRMCVRVALDIDTSL